MDNQGFLSFVDREVESRCRINIYLILFAIVFCEGW